MRRRGSPLRRSFFFDDEPEAREPGDWTGVGGADEWADEQRTVGFDRQPMKAVARVERLPVVNRKANAVGLIALLLSSCLPATEPPRRAVDTGGEASPPMGAGPLPVPIANGGADAGAVAPLGTRNDLANRATIVVEAKLAPPRAAKAYLELAWATARSLRNRWHPLRYARL